MRALSLGSRLASVLAFCEFIYALIIPHSNIWRSLTSIQPAIASILEYQRSKKAGKELDEETAAEAKWKIWCVHYDSASLIIGYFGVLAVCVRWGLVLTKKIRTLSRSHLRSNKEETAYPVMPGTKDTMLKVRIVSKGRVCRRNAWLNRLSGVTRSIKDPHTDYPSTI